MIMLMSKMMIFSSKPAAAAADNDVNNDMDGNIDGDIGVDIGGAVGGENETLDSLS